MRRARFCVALSCAVLLLTFGLPSPSRQVVAQATAQPTSSDGESDTAKPATKASAVPEGPPFFNAHDLTGWEGLPGAWRVEHDSIIGSLPSPRPAPTFLCSKGVYKDFELRFRVRLADGIGISGVQFRSKLTDPKTFSVTGSQCAIRGTSAAGDYPTGSLRNEPAGTPQEMTRAKKFGRFFRDKQINEIRIRCEGKHVLIKVNGFTMVNQSFPALPAEGIIAWELDGQNPPRTVEFSNIRFTDLSRRTGKEGVRPPSYDLGILKAEADYTAAVHKAEEKLLAEFDTQIKKIEGGKSSGTEGALLLDVVGAEKKEFHDKGRFPLSKPMRRSLKNYLTAVGDAERKMAAKIKTASTAAESRHDEKAVDNLVALTATLLTPHVAAVWKRPRGKNVQFLSDETLMIPEGKNPDAIGYWSISQEGDVNVGLPADKEEKYSTGQGTIADDGRSLQIHFATGKPQTWELVDE